MKFIEIKDLVGLSGPLQKCVDVISAGMGTLYRPKAMRNEADAKAYEITAIAKAEALANVIASQGQANAQLKYIKTLAVGEQEIFERPRVRLIARELEGQQNIESITQYAIRPVPEMVLDKPISSDWRRKFFLEGRNCDADMQETFRYRPSTIERYQNLTGDSGIAAYKIENDSVTVEFNDRATYLYNYMSAGRNHIETMKALAIAGQGLSSFISKYVRKGYAAQLR